MTFRPWAFAALFLSVSAFAQNLYVLSTAYSGKATLHRRGVHVGAALHEISPNLNPSLSQDSVVRVSGGLLFVLERSLQFQQPAVADRIRIWNPQNWNEAPKTVALGLGANPQDVVYVPALGKAFVSQYGKNEIAVIDPIAGQTLAETIDLASFVDPQDSDGKVEMHRLRRIGDTLYVTLQCQNSFVVNLPAKLVEIELNQTPYAVSAVTLETRRNPTSSVQSVTVDGAERLLIGYSGKGDFGTPADAMDGFVALHDAASLEELEAWQTDGVALGVGDVSDVAVRPGNAGFYAALSGSTSSSVWYSPFAGSAGTQLSAVAAGFAHPEIAVDAVNQKLYVVRRDSLTQGTVRIFDTASNAAYATWTIDAARPPYSIALDESLTTATRQPASPEIRLAIAPNPAPDGRATLTYAFDRAATCGLNVTNALGQVVFQSSPRAMAGRNTVDLNLIAEPRGVYVVQLRCGNRVGATRWVR